METSIRTFGGGWIEQLTYRLKMVIQIMIGQTLMSLGAKLAGVDWGEYKSDVIDNSDCRKYGDM